MELATDLLIVSVCRIEKYFNVVCRTLFWLPFVVYISFFNSNQKVIEKVIWTINEVSHCDPRDTGFKSVPKISSDSRIPVLPLMIMSLIVIVVCMLGVYWCMSINVTDRLDRANACLKSVLRLMWIRIRCDLLQSKDWPLLILVLLQMNCEQEVKEFIMHSHY